ncbi:hypothetical protein SKAU_G00009710 [Synaphobranchus kaupii]|uniref:Uncharacterized protein n=1 Tax=Synaphobranchus kaupii TaxID=118154 RepID=A0A9Q1GAX2_SYNKA|nr:hypothetical protein SKAU_G00009710 [Synaphobranchus kaupii]
MVEGGEKKGDERAEEGGEALEDNGDIYLRLAPSTFASAPRQAVTRTAIVATGIITVTQHAVGPGLQYQGLVCERC